MLSYLYGGPDAPMQVGMNSFLGIESFWPMTSLTEGIPEGATVNLIGDARAFWYPLPMSRMKYRTVFDVDGKDPLDIVQAWEGRTLPADAWLVVDPSELDRFEQTYWGLPPVPRWVTEAAPRDATGHVAPFACPARLH